MRTKRQRATWGLAILLLTGPALLYGQGEQVVVAVPEGWSTRVFEIRYADPQRIQEALSLFNARSRAVSDLGLVSVSAPEAMLPAIEDVISRLDVPRQNVELRVQILGADFQRITTTKELPEELEGVIEELGEVFSYQSFQLLETIIIRGIDRYQATTNGSLPINGGIYRFSGRLRVRGAGQAEEVLGLENMQFGMTTPEGNAAINTSLEVPAGRQVVVGRAALGSGAVVLVMSVDFLD